MPRLARYVLTIEQIKHDQGALVPGHPDFGEDGAHAVDAVHRDRYVRHQRERAVAEQTRHIRRGQQAAHTTANAAGLPQFTRRG